MELAVPYTKKRAEFGHHTEFDDVPTQILSTVPSEAPAPDEYIKRNPCVTTLDTTPLLSEHDVNTDRVLRRNQGMRHYEGGWPENVDASEADQVDRYLKRANKETKLKQAVVELSSTVETAVRQNNTIDMYEDYFRDYSLDLSSEPPSAKGLAVFRDPSAVKRTVTSVNWHPEGTRIACAYSILRFQDERLMAGRLPPSSFIWDVTYPNHPVTELVPPSPLVSLRYNVKTPDTLVGGCYNGLVAVFDIKKPRGVAITTSSIDKSHHDPVYDVFWVQSKTNNQFASVSTDGQMMWWDTRKLSEPTEVVMLNDGSGRVLGGSAMEYNIEAGPAKYLVGTEQGVVLQLNMRRRGGKGGSDAGLVQAQDQGSGKHHGPIYSIQRNPLHTTSYLTVGDWTARVWNEKNKTPIMMTPYCKAYLTAGCWSPTRAGVFYTARMDGVLDVWDIYHRQNAPAYSHKVADAALSSIAVQGTAQSGGGRLIAVGDVSGTVSLLEVSENLAVPPASEKVGMGLMFERESRREESLEKRAIALARAAKAASAKGGDDGGAGGAGGGERDDALEETLRKVDSDFMALIKEAEEAEGGDQGAEAGAGRGGAGGDLGSAGGSVAEEKSASSAGAMGGAGGPSE